MNTFLFKSALDSPAQLWVTLILAGLLTYGIRLSFVLLFSQREIPGWLRQALRFVPPAVLTAIIFPELLINNNTIDITFGNGRLIAGLIAILVAWKTKSAVLTIVIGMATLWLLQVVLHL
ncbi:MAG: Branched-chain amino acid transport [Chloroflexi bacterium]|nr:Branched-chain amino acid transport [Chloroflexota bacterium]